LSGKNNAKSNRLAGFRVEADPHRAYVDARYSPHYKITAEELAWLGEHVTALQELVKTACEERLDVLRAGG